MRLRTPVRRVLKSSSPRRRLLAMSLACGLCAAAALPATADTTQDQLQQLRAQEANQRSQLDQLNSQQQSAQAALSQLKATLDARRADLGGGDAQVAQPTR